MSPLRRRLKSESQRRPAAMRICMAIEAGVIGRAQACNSQIEEGTNPALVAEAGRVRKFPLRRVERGLGLAQECFVQARHVLVRRVAHRGVVAVNVQHGRVAFAGNRLSKRKTRVSPRVRRGWPEPSSEPEVDDQSGRAQGRYAEEAKQEDAWEEFFQSVRADHLLQAAQHAHVLAYEKSPHLLRPDCCEDADGGEVGGE